MEFRKPNCFLSVRCSSNEVPLWQRMERTAPVMLYDVHPDTDEGAILSSLFHKTLVYPDFLIQRLFRVQNPILWLHYALKRKQIEQDLGGLDADERRLFHGTYRDRLEAIVRQGFDWRIGKTHGKMFGNGTYFARQASCAHEFTDCGGNKFSARWTADSGFMESREFFRSQVQMPTLGSKYPQFLNQPFITIPGFHTDQDSDDMTNGRPRYKTQTSLAYENGTSDIWSLFNTQTHPLSHYMIVAKVLIGRYTTGIAGLQRPPPYDQRDSLVRLYDSCVDSILNPEKFVIFDNNQAYPEYVIEYRDLRWNK
ncbi:protein mono-ADP-ribosyltransferase PARP11-like isoform X2 [Biomphalaria glabrata]|uniref:Poly [ADP-ribose] polymerase n=1 Tax=Biomphalaria glabrata TaxID=6526 RepID=A0A9W3AVU0_BIOGL|nr:protein mono-ADP-ribosyltransferase PARP11-like isoform X2 [Biomphalaria glabrata]